MNSTRPERSVQHDLDAWTANLLMRDPARAALIAHLLFSTPEKLRARLAYGGKSALVTAAHISASLELAIASAPELFEAAATGGFLSSRPCKVTVSGSRDRQPRERGASLRCAPSGDGHSPSQ